MRLLLVWLQHLLIVLPAVATLYVTNVTSTAVYVGFVLIALLFVRLTELAPRLAYILLPLEIIGFGWLYSTYGGLIYFFLYSGLISAFLYFRKSIEVAAMALLTCVVLNSVIQEDSLHELWVHNLIWFTVTLLLSVILLANRKQAGLEQIVDVQAVNQDHIEQERDRALEYARKIEDYAQVQERGRIATELHDDLGHRLIRVKMMTEAALQIMEHDPKQTIRMIEQVRDQLEESMNNMRYTVRKLQPAESHNVRKYALHRLIEDAARDNLIDVSFEVTGRPFPLYPSIEFVLYRNAQEAITNAVRHGGATAVQIELVFTDKQVTMNITNNGKLPSQISYGMGLNGMQDRLAVIGGQLVVSLDREFIISTIVPVQDTSQRSGGE